jgi:hypothetical protein
MRFLFAIYRYINKNFALAKIILSNTNLNDVQNPPMGSSLMFFDLSSQLVVMNSSGVTQSFNGGLTGPQGVPGLTGPQGVPGLTGPQGGDTFPYTGDAVIDGSLNIDFTETLDTVMRTDFELDTLLPGSGFGLRFIGSAIGVFYDGEDDTVFSGLLDGNLVIDIEGDLYQAPTISDLYQQTDKNTGIRIVSQKGKFIYPPEFGGDEVIFSAPLDVTVPGESEGDFTRYWVRFDTDDQEALSILKSDQDGQGISIKLDKDFDGVQVLTTQSESSICEFRELGEASSLDIRTDSIMSEVIANNDFEDDTAAALGGVPLNGLYHTGGMIKIRLS